MNTLPNPIERLGQFLSQPPPRHTVPPDMRRRAMRGWPFILGLVGWGLFLLGLPMAFLFAPQRQANERALNRHAALTHEARVTRVEDTGNRINNVRVYRYDFTFQSADGANHTGHSFTSGRIHEPAAPVEVEYLADYPSAARLRGSRLSPFGGTAWFGAIHPLIGAGLVAVAWVGRRRRHALLVQGRFAAGRVTSIEETSIRINRHPAFKVFVTFAHERGETRSPHYAYGSELVAARRKLDDGATVGVLFDPANPNRYLLADRLIAT